MKGDFTANRITLRISVNTYGSQYLRWIVVVHSIDMNTWNNKNLCLENPSTKKKNQCSIVQSVSSPLFAKSRILHLVALLVSHHFSFSSKIPIVFAVLMQKYLPFSEKQPLNGVFILILWDPMTLEPSALNNTIPILFSLGYRRRLEIVGENRGRWYKLLAFVNRSLYFRGREP